MANTPPETAPVALARKERYPAAYESSGAGAPTTSRRHEPPVSGGERLKGGLRPGGSAVNELKELESHEQ